MNIQEEFRSKLVSAEKAVKLVKSGDWVDYGWCVNQPVALDRALAARANELEDVKIRTAISMLEPAILKVPDFEKHFTWHSWHFSKIDRDIAGAGKGFFIPLRYQELGGFFEREFIDSDVLFITVTPMDANGDFSFALSTSHLAENIARAKKIVLEINTNMPWVPGRSSTINIRDIDYVVEGPNEAVPGIPASRGCSEAEADIAKLIIEQIPNGASLQLGIGGMPNALGKMIAESDLKDLGVHTEMYVDAYADMADAGKLSGKYKNIDTGLQLYSFAAGSQKMYDYMNNNPDILGAPVAYVCDPYVIAQLDNFMSINNALEIDLYGQVSAETIGFRQISGTGGQLDFNLGAYLSKGGKSFICLTSSFKDKAGNIKSRIKPVLEPGTIVTTPRSTVHYICTEYGIVNLRGMTTWQRAEALIALAHPDLRDDLIRSAEKQNIWRRTSKKI